MSRRLIGILAGATVSLFLAAGAWLAWPVAPAPLAGADATGRLAALLDRAQAGEPRAMGELRAEIERLAESRDAATDPLRAAAMLHGLAGRLEGSIASLEGRPASTATEALALLPALGGGLALTAALLMVWAQRRPKPAASPPLWAEALRATLAQAEAERRAEAALAAGRQAELAEELAQLAQLAARAAGPAPAAPPDARIARLLERLDMLAASIAEGERRGAAQAEALRGALSRVEAGVQAASGPIAIEAEALAVRLDALLPRIEEAALRAQTTRPALGDLADLAAQAGQAVARMSDETLARLGAATDAVTRAGIAALGEAEGSLRAAAETLHGQGRGMAETLGTEVARLRAAAGAQTAITTRLEAVTAGGPVLLARLEEAAATLDRAGSAAVHHLDTLPERLAILLPPLEEAADRLRLATPALAEVAGLTAQAGQAMARLADEAGVRMQRATENMTAAGVATLDAAATRLEDRVQALSSVTAAHEETARELAGTSAAIEAAALSMPDVGALLRPLVEEAQAAVAASVQVVREPAAAPPRAAAHVDAEVAQLLAEAQARPAA